MIRIERLQFSVGTFALKNVSLDVAPGQYFVLLGPSGAGKTLLLECLCGLNRIDSGRVLLGGLDVTRLEPRERGVGYLPQDYALFPHRTVRQNVRFGLKYSPIPAEDVAGAVRRVMEMTGVAHLADRLPHNLSGGEKQRVALARALAIRPRVLLLDEPVSALDEQTRDGLCHQLKQLQRSTGTTTVHVCHNFAEMLAVADYAGIIHDGRILQVGTPREILERPRSRLVAQFVQAGNLFPARARLDDQWLRLACPGQIEFRAPRPTPGEVAGDVVVMIRPENVCLETSGSDPMPPGTTMLEGAVRQLTDAGPVVRLTVACGAGMELLVTLGKREYNAYGLRPGDRVQLEVKPQDVHVLEE
jgi:ABC-type Fe3+/spermidine/putrescine transport system ATPase subunit